jgi:hypothetical protein
MFLQTHHEEKKVTKILLHCKNYVIALELRVSTNSPPGEKVPKICVGSYKICSFVTETIGFKIQ